MSPTKSVQKVQPMALSCHGLTVVHAKSQCKILVADAGQLVALMGANGAGKIILESLSVEGKVLVNGHSLGRAITYVSGYVQQDDLFMGTLTVEQKEHQMTQFISGGEARRLLLLFASRLLNNPQNIFVDEPTTGFNWSMVDSVISVMRALTSSGHTIIFTIHQPLSGIPKALMSYVSLPLFCGPIEVTGNLCCRAVADLNSANCDSDDEQMPMAQSERALLHRTIDNLAGVVRQLADKDEQLRTKEQQVADKDAQIRTKDAQIRTKEQQVADKDAQIRTKDGQLTQLTNTNSHLVGQLAQKDARIAQLEAWIRHCGGNVPPPLN